MYMYLLTNESVDLFTAGVQYIDRIDTNFTALGKVLIWQTCPQAGR